MTIKMSGRDDEIGHIERQETIPIEASGISLRQHKGLADTTLGVDVTEVGTRKKTVVAT